MNKFIQFSIATFATALLVNCAGPSSNTTGWAINDKRMVVFANLGYQGQEVGPGLVFVEGNLHDGPGRKTSLRIEYSSQGNSKLVLHG